MAVETLRPLQKKFIVSLAANKYLKEHFYLTGGTALAAYYLKHRYSEDLDFFSLNSVDTMAIDVFIKDLKNILSIKKVDYQQSFNRNIFFIHTTHEILKTEFTYFPFDQIKKPWSKDGILIDSIADIATNKAFTILQNPRARDFIDLYCILTKYKDFSFPNLLKMARIKFDAQIDPIQLGTQLLKAKNIRDLPLMIKKIDEEKWRQFFINESKSLSKKIFK